MKKLLFTMVLLLLALACFPALAGGYGFFSLTLPTGDHDVQQQGEMQIVFSTNGSNLYRISRIPDGEAAFLLDQGAEGAVQLLAENQLYSGALKNPSMMPASFAGNPALLVSGIMQIGGSDAPYSTLCCCANGELYLISLGTSYVSVDENNALLLGFAEEIVVH